MYIPLLLAPFYDTNLVFPSTLFHDLTIILRTNKKPESLELYGKKYFVEDRFNLYKNPHEFVITQNQQGQKEAARGGKNTYKLYFSYPVYLMYIEGIEDIKKIKNVKLAINGKAYYDGSIQPLLYHTKSRYPPGLKPITFCFTDSKPNSEWKTALNFSIIDKAELEIVLDDDVSETNIYIGCLNANILQYVDGMVGMRWGC